MSRLFHKRDLEFGMTTLLAYWHLLGGMAIGVVAETGARLMRLWRYRSIVWPLANVPLMFGVVQGLLVGWVIGGRQEIGAIAPVLFMVGAVAGILLEGLNAYWWRGWSWGEKPLLGIERSIDKAAFVGVAWGLAPILTVVIARLVVIRGLDFTA